MIAPDRIQFDPESHAYALDGAEVPSVTTVLDGEGLSGSPFWTEADRRRGSAVHRIALLMGSGPIIGDTAEEIVSHSAWDPQRTAPVLVGYGLSVAEFYATTGFRPQLIEQPVASAKYGICGTLDAWGNLGGKMVLVDFKSGNPQESANIQTALYAMCLEETKDLLTDGRTVVWIKSDGTFKMYPVRPPGGQDLTIGLSAVNLYKWRKANGMLG
jgi:hypothetical protein